MSKETVRYANSIEAAHALAFALSERGHTVTMERAPSLPGVYVVHVRPFAVHSALTVDRSAIVEREEGGGVWVITLNEGGDL